MTEQELFEKLRKQTGIVVRDAETIQFFASEIISHFYLKEVNKFFIHDVLTNELSTFGFIKNVLKIVLLRSKINKTTIESLDGHILRLGQIRNIFAH